MVDADLVHRKLTDDWIGIGFEGVGPLVAVFGVAPAGFV
jgi:hypothetical protein